VKKGAEDFCPSHAAMLAKPPDDVEQAPARRNRRKA